MVEKVENAQMKCLSCGVTLTCRKKTYPAYKDKPEREVLQWQHEEGKAHYKWVSDGKYDCVKSEGKEQQNTSDGPNEPVVSTSPPKDKVPEIDAELKEQILGETLIQYQIHLTIKEFLEKFEDSPNGGMIGQFTKICYDKFVVPKFTKASQQ